MRTDSFLLAPLIAAGSDLVLTAPRLVFESAFVRSKVVLFAPPLTLPELHLHMVWDARRGQDAKLAWLRALVGGLRPGAPPAPATSSARRAARGPKRRAPRT
jgi:hypothetical protein